MPVVLLHIGDCDELVILLGEGSIVQFIPPDQGLAVQLHVFHFGLLLRLKLSQCRCTVRVKDRASNDILAWICSLCRRGQTSVAQSGSPISGNNLAQVCRYHSPSPELRRSLRMATRSFLEPDETPSPPKNGSIKKTVK